MLTLLKREPQQKEAIAREKKGAIAYFLTIIYDLDPQIAQ